MKFGYAISYVPDVKATVAFYEKAFGLTAGFADDEGQFAELETGGTAIAFAQEDMVRDMGVDFTPLRPEHPPAGVEIALVTDDVAAALDRALRAGATVVRHPERKPWGQTVAYVRDLNGMLVELCTPVS